MIALVPARGGSKGLPRKNILPFCGKPLIAHTIEAAKSSPAIDRIVVSTDDPEIASISREFGAEAPFLRPADLATDAASSRDVMLHALSFLEQQGAPAGCFCLLQPTSPLRTAAEIDGALEVFRERRADSVISVTAYEHPIQWALQMLADGRLAPGEATLVARRQDLLPYYRPNGAIYVYETAFFRRAASHVGPRSYGYLMPPERSVDIDTPLDFLWAETLARHLAGKTHG